MQHRACDTAWRSAIARPLDYVSQQARAADLIITGANRDGLLLDPLRRLDPSDLVMQAGRPLFVVPPEAEFLGLKNALVAWKDTREARRAVADALPFSAKLKKSTWSKSSRMIRSGVQRGRGSMTWLLG